jgi:hypothetical protein
MTADDRSNQDTRDLRNLYYGVRTEVEVIKVGLANLKEAQDKTNKILLWIALLIGGSVVTAMLNVVLKGALT